MLKGLIFDMDGTLTWTDELHFKAYQKVLAELGIHLSYKDYIERFTGRGSRSFFTILLEEHEMGDQHIGKDHAQMKLEECIQKKSEYFSEILKSHKVRKIKGVEKFLQSALTQGLKLIVASGASRENIQKILTNAGLLQYFLDYVSVNEVEHPKPYPDVFSEAAKRLALDVSECIVFEDAINGVQAAKAAQLYCVGLETNIKRELLIEAGADIVIRDYDEISEKLLIFNQ